MEVDDRSASGIEAGPSGREGGHSGQNGHASGRAGGMPQQSSSLPMLASACPGWVCYAEKTHGDLVLPFISSTRSPQVLSAPCMGKSPCTCLDGQLVRNVGSFRQDISCSDTLQHFPSAGAITQ